MYWYLTIPLNYHVDKFPRNHINIMKYRYKTAQFTWWYYLFKPMVISKSKSQLNICWEKIKLYIGNYPGQQLKQYHHKWHHNVPIHTKHEHKPTEKWQVNKYFHKTLTSSLSIIWTKLMIWTSIYNFMQIQWIINIKLIKYIIVIYAIT